MAAKFPKFDANLTYTCVIPGLMLSSTSSFPIKESKLTAAIFSFFVYRTRFAPN
ncbi:hypothetical protein SLEP1_g39288 [Rubroshorea leprosula]|uniref:Uncharacterized protein n=1 Tax=Rubroshorea leprosula TaxID=152421 RepID=A0AAV5L049_9ROSI|nr:hypothetical protein SLEP1_g39288 [Rubroshorea leprosula]